MEIQSGYEMQGLGPVQAGQLEKVSLKTAIDDVKNDESSSLQISGDIRIHKSSLSSQIEKINGGIAVAALAQSGIVSQKGLLEEVKSEVLKIDGDLSEDEKSFTIENINNKLNQFNDIAQNTSYGSQFPLKTEDNVSDDLSISTDEGMIPLEKVDTVSVGEESAAFVSDFLMDKTSKESLLNSFEQSMDKLNVYENSFDQASKDMESNIKDVLNAQKEISSSKGKMKEIDFGKESADFNKTTLQSQIGYLMQTQANAQQAKNIVLLS